MSQTIAAATTAEPGGTLGLRATLADVHTRARRVGAAAATLREIGDSLRHGVEPPSMLDETLAALARDVARLAKQVASVRTAAHGTPPATASVTFDRATVADAMHRGLITCSAGASVAEVAEAMTQASIHCVVVADADGRRPWSVINDLDLMGALADGAHDARAAALAATEVPLVGLDAPLADAARIMRDDRIAHLVVIEPSTARPVGVVSSLDIAHAVAAQRPSAQHRE